MSGDFGHADGHGPGCREIVEAMASMNIQHTNVPVISISLSFRINLSTNNSSPYRRVCLVLPPDRGNRCSPSLHPCQYDYRQGQGFGHQRWESSSGIRPTSQLSHHNARGRCPESSESRTSSKYTPLGQPKRPLEMSHNSSGRHCGMVLNCTVKLASVISSTEDCSTGS